MNVLLMHDIMHDASHHITSHDITPYHMTSHHITSPAADGGPGASLGTQGS